MKKYVNGQYIEMTTEEIADMQAKHKQHFQSIPYDELVNNEIRKRYSESQEFAILRQKDEKPEEYKAYYDYCEECKEYAKSKLN